MDHTDVVHDPDELDELDELRAALATVMPGVVDDLKRLVAIPSCAFPGFPADPVLQMAEATVELLRRSGLDDARLVDVPDGYPMVYGEIPAPPGRPTVLLYAHYDVQPAPVGQGWTTDPWTPSVHGGRLYGRGAADDKSGIAMHAATLQVFGGRPPVGIKVVIEGEEETDSHLETLVENNPELFHADVYVIADGGNEEVGVPVLETSTRGYVAFDVEVATLRQAVHSGLFGGGAPDALLALIKMLATLHDDDGAVAVPGLARFEWTGSDADEQLHRRAAGVLDGVSLMGRGSLAGRLWAEPAVSVVGLDAPRVDGAVNALVPRARATVSLRIPPGADPDAEARVVKEHLTRETPWGVHVTFGPVATGQPWRTRDDGPVLNAASRAMREVYGATPGVIGSGGSIPLLNALQQVNPASEFVLWGAEDGAEANIHSADESVDLAELERATLCQCRLLSVLAGTTVAGAGR
ncbi:MAG: M20/M25/M40 family metallo-hydrolase [Actinomycetes bacterium]